MVIETLPKGYKQTEVGVIPEDWELISWEEAFDFLSTATYSRDQLSNNEEIAYIHYGDIHTKLKHFLDFEKISFPSITAAKAKNYSLIAEGDLIMADASEDYEGVGKSVEVKNIKDRKAVSGLHTFLMRDKKGRFVNGFRAYISSNKLVKRQFDRLATGLKVYGVSKNNLKLVLIPYPKPNEQSAIARVLSDTDTLLESLDKFITKKKNIKQGTMQELLTGKRRLPGFEGKWEVKKLGEIAEVKKGELITEKTRILGSIPVIAGGKTPAYYHNRPNRLKKTITISASGAYAGYVGFHANPIFASDCSTIEENDNYSIKFIYYHLLRIQNKIYNVQTGGAQPHVHPSDLIPLELNYSENKEEQSAIAQVLSDMDLEIEELEQKRDKYKQLKTGLMQQLLTGKMRLKWQN